MQEKKSHWDLMLELETEKVLATWQVSEPPRNWAEKIVFCPRLANHRLDYLSYEGAVSGDRGEVKIFAAGEYHPIQVTETLWRIYLCSDNIMGTLELSCQNKELWYLNFQGLSV